MSRAAAQTAAAREELFERLLAKKGLASGGIRRIGRRTEEGSPPLSFAQERLWFLEQLVPEGGTYHVPLAQRVRGELSVPALEATLSEVVRRHEVLRTRFETADGAPVQGIEPYRLQPLPRVDLTGVASGDREGEGRRLALEHARRPFDLESGPLVRWAQVEVGPRDRLLLLDMHHIAGDGWSVEILRRELETLFSAFSAGLPSPLDELPIQYADYAAWQRSWLAGEELERQLEYWRSRLEGLPPLLELPTDRQRSGSGASRAGSARRRLPPGLAERVREHAESRGISVFATLLAVYKALLYRWSGQPDVVVGTPVAGRTRREVEGLIGFFVNSLVLRTWLSGDAAFEELARRVQDTVLDGQAHQDLPFEKLVEELAPERHLSHAPLFQVVFSLGQRATTHSHRPTELGGASFAPLSFRNPRAKFDLSLGMSEGPEGLRAVAEYDTDLFDATTIERLLHSLEVLLGAAVSAPERPVAELPVLSAPERQALLVEWNDTERACPGRPLVHERVTRVASERPDAVAVVSSEGAWSYGELEARSNRLARRLRRLGVGPEVRVAVVMERTLTRTAAILGVVKAGGAYVSVDVTYPAERLAFVLSDAEAAVVLTESGSPVEVPPGGAEVLELDPGWRCVAEESAAAVEPGVDPEHVAYVVYTSGSTGKPKGVEVPHAGLTNLVRWHQGCYGVESSDRGTQVASPSFDASIWEYWPYLTAGASSHVPDEETRLSSSGMLGWWGEQGITLAYLPTPLAEGVLEEGVPADAPGVRALIIGGDRLHRGPDPGVRYRLMNHYGPAEYSVVTTVVEVAPEGEGADGAPTIGRALDNTRMYVLDRAGEPVPLGSPGELSIGGLGLARGYLGRPGRTAESFVPEPFGEAPGARMYRTGDRVRYRVDGDMDFLGRLDHQVKVRGLRIELGEIESVLGEHPAVREAVVVVREDRPGDKRLVAYLTGGEETPSAEALSGYLGERLPDYMVPAAFVVLERLPLTPNGKVDRRALPEPAWSGEAEYVAPRSPVEEVLAEIWAEVLGVERVGVRDDFFELGGHSLLATRVVSRMREVFQAEVALRSLFEHPTVAELGAVVTEALAAGPGSPPLIPVSRDEAPLLLSFAQERLWFLDQLVPGSNAYNIPMAQRVRGALAPAALESTLSEVMRRHEVLRTRFEVADGTPVQAIEPYRPWPLPRVDLQGLVPEDREAEVRRLAAEEARRPFDLARGPLVRWALVELAFEERVLLFDMHHVASDGWSVGVLRRELGALYPAHLSGRPTPLADLPVQYADFAAWQRGWLAGEELERQLGFWRAQLDGVPPLLELPLDRPRPAVLRQRGATRSRRYPVALAAGLRTLSRQQGATLFMTALAGFQALLGRLSGQPLLAVGTPISGRNRLEVEDLIGFFVNTLVLRGDLTGAPDFRELVARVREASLEAHAHQDLPFEKLVEELAPERSLDHAPLFQVLFVLQVEGGGSVAWEGVELEPLATGTTTAKFDLSLGMSEGPEGLRAVAEYDTDLFDATTIERLLRSLEVLLGAAVSAPERPVAELPVLAPPERQALLLEWNDHRTPESAAESLGELFILQAERTPDRVALACGTERVTYAQLAWRAVEVARRLMAAGVAPEERVGLLARRSPRLLESLLGILQAGCAYVALDPAYPEERLRLMLEDAGARLLVTEPGLAEERLPAAQVRELRTVLLGAEDEASPDAPSAETLPRVAAGQLAYVVYTSGSTGRPKGVAIEHRSAVEMVRWAGTAFSATELSAVLASTSICFDLSVFELFAPLAHGGSLVLVEDVLALGEAGSAAPEPTLVNTVPSALTELLAGGELPDRTVTVALAGEPLPPALAERVHAGPRARRLLDLYGPSEDTTYSTGAELPARTVPTIGRPLANTRARVLGPEGRAVPLGAPGELFLSGRGLARGYLGAPGPTAERFVPEPGSCEPGARAYRTGDAVRLLPDGRIDFLGRLDHQVKVRGFRIELGEIETVLAEHPEVREAVAVVRSTDPADRRIAAFVVPAGPAPLATEALREAARRRLPGHMVPSHLTLLDELPRLPNGKIDRKALSRAKLDRPDPDRVFVAPRDETEAAVAGLFSELLGVEGVGARDGFFALGGHSMLAVRLVRRIEERTGRRIPLTLLFEEPTVEGLARHLRGGATDPEGASSLVRLKPEGDGTALFFVHPVSGQVSPYLDLARRLDGHRFFAFQSRGLVNGGKADESVEEMAHHYLGLMRRQQTPGHYALGGWSMGGVVAFEMARQLREAGEEVPLLVLLDSELEIGAARLLEAPAGLNLLVAFAAHLGLDPARLSDLRRELRKAPQDRRLEALLAVLVRREVLPGSFELPALVSSFRVFRANLQALEDYSPGGAHPGPVQFFRALHGREEPAQRLDGWSSHLSGEVEVLPVPGTHFTILNRDNVDRIAVAISRRLASIGSPSPEERRER